MDRYSLKQGKFGSFFYDNTGGATNEGHSLHLEIVLEKLNRIEGYKARLRKANKGRRTRDQY